MPDAHSCTEATDTATFVLCIEDNAIRAQALLLCESIRQFGGRHRSAPIVAIAPRPGLGIDSETQARLEALGVEYVEAPLNLVCPGYGSANRVFAAAWSEQHTDSDWIVVLDSDTVFLAEPELPSGADVGVRPVDTKGSASSGPGDPYEGYWEQLAELQGLSLDALPFVRTTVTGIRVRACYNGGLVVARREAGILRAWADLFTRSVVAGLKPRAGTDRKISGSTGYVGKEASEYWGSNQAAAALVIWSMTARVFDYSDAYNLPLHLLGRRRAVSYRLRRSPPVHVHYHGMFTRPDAEPALAKLRLAGTPRDQLDWLRERLPLR
jgi:hypothetical protein